MLKANGNLASYLVQLTINYINIQANQFISVGVGDVRKCLIRLRHIYINESVLFTIRDPVLESKSTYHDGLTTSKNNHSLLQKVERLKTVPTHYN